MTAPISPIPASSTPSAPSTPPAPAISSTIIGDDGARRVVFLHGLFGRGKNFTRIAKALQPEMQSLLVDLPNHGHSAWTDEISYPLFADIIAEHLREGFAADGPIDLIGHSMGGKVAMVLVLRHPDLVNHLVVIDIAPSVGSSGPGEFQHLLDSLAKLDLATLKTRNEADAELQAPIPQAGTRGFLLQNLARTKTGFAWEPNLDLLRQELPTITDFPDMEGEQFQGPVLWIGGSESRYITDDDEPAMRSLFPFTVRMTIHGAGHWVHSEKPEETIEALRGFLLD